MTNTPYLDGIELLIDAFQEENKPFWKVYAGYTAKGKKVGENTEESDMETSLQSLVALLERYGKGTFTIVLMKKHGTNNAGAIQHTVKLSGVEVAGTGQQPFGNMGGFGQIFQLWGQMQNQLQQSISGVYEAADERVSQLLELERLKRDLKEVRSGTTYERLATKAVETLIPAIANRLDGSPRQMGITGYTNRPAGYATAKKGDAVGEEAEGEEVEEIAFSIDQAMNDLARIQGAFPDMPVNDLLTKLANFIEQKPEMAANMLNQL